MRIISDFHDYYDAVQATGQDQTLLYLRKAVEEETKDYPFPMIAYHRRWSWWSRMSDPSVSQYTIGFCGKIYPVVNCGHNTYCHNVEDVDVYMEANYREKVLEEYRYPLKHSRHHRYWDAALCRNAFEKWFEEMKAKQNAFGHIFLKHKCPIFIASCEEGRHGDKKFVYDGQLKPFEFFRVIEPFTAFQEISMFLGGMAMPNRPIPEVSDKDLAAAKGFDKFSFRKDPSKK